MVSWQFHKLHAGGFERLSRHQISWVGKVSGSGNGSVKPVLKWEWFETTPAHQINSKMMTFEKYVLLLQENAAPRSYACLMLDCYDFKDYLTGIQKQIEDDDLYTEEEGHGLETEPHITVLYGIHEQDPKVVKSQLDLGPAEYTLTGLSLFENDDYDVLKCTVKSKDLKAFNKQCTDNLEYTNKFPDYIPHMTVAYLKPGTGKKYVKLNCEKFNEVLSSNKFTFSTKDSKKSTWTF